MLSLVARPPVVLYIMVALVLLLYCSAAPSNARALEDSFEDGVSNRRASVAGDFESFRIQDYDYGDPETNDESNAELVNANGAGSGCRYPFDPVVVTVGLR